MPGWGMKQIMAAYRVDEPQAFRRWIKANGLTLPLVDRQAVKAAVGRYRQEGGK